MFCFDESRYSLFGLMAGFGYGVNSEGPGMGLHFPAPSKFNGNRYKTLLGIAIQVLQFS